AQPDHAIQEFCGPPQPARSDSSTLRTLPSHGHAVSVERSHRKSLSGLHAPMISASRSGAVTVLSRPTLASFFLLALLGVPPHARALSPQSSGAPSAEQQPAQNPTKKNSASTASDSAASKTNSPKAHRVLTNDDLSLGSDIPIAPGAPPQAAQSMRPHLLQRREETAHKFWLHH